LILSISSFHKSEGKYVLIKFNIEHNHELNPDVLKHSVISRRLTDAQKFVVRDLAAKKVPNEEIINTLERDFGKFLTPQDLYNKLVALKGEKVPDSIKSLVEVLCLNREGYDCALTRDAFNPDRFRTILWWNREMFAKFLATRDVLIIDSTYRVNHFNLPLTVFVSIDGNGQSYIVFLALIQRENSEEFKDALRLVKEALGNVIHCFLICRFLPRQFFVTERKHLSRLPSLYSRLQTWLYASGI
jgi:hypothetical protein